MGIGINFIGRKVGEEIKKFIQLIFEARKDDNRNALLYNSAGEDSVPLNDERLVLVKVDGTGKYVALAVLTPSQGAKPGEKIFFGRDQKGNITVKISMLNSGDFILDTDTETTDDATGKYDRKIKGLTTILERKDRNYTNEENVHNMIEKDKTETIGGDLTEGIDGDRNTELGGSDTENISGDANWSIGGNLSITVGGNVTINGAKINLN